MPTQTESHYLGAMLEDSVAQSEVRDTGPTRYLPGDLRKVAVIEDRVAFGMSPTNDADAKLPPRWAWVAQRGDNGREVAWTLYDADGNVVLEKRLEGGQWCQSVVNDYLKTSA